MSMDGLYRIDLCEGSKSGICEQFNEPSGFIKYSKFLQKDPAVWSETVTLHIWINVGNEYVTHLILCWQVPDVASTLNNEYSEILRVLQVTPCRSWGSFLKQATAVSLTSLRIHYS
jgi:hypothetical protein